MPCFKAHCNGISIGVPPTKNNHSRAKRKEITGWSESATRRNTAFLYSVDTKSLDDYLGLAITCTIVKLPETSDDWSRMVNLFIQRLRRMGVVMYHWVVEWQKRGVPHLHGMLYFDRSVDITEIKQIKIHWLDSVYTVNKDSPSIGCQTVKPVTSSQGWVQYLGKHGSRGLRHYQRADKPTSWQKTGRMWGKGGKWPVRTSEGEIDISHFHRFRRLVKRWRLSDARSDTDLSKRSKRIAYARKMLKNPNKNLSTVRGISEWIPEDLSLLMLQTTEGNNEI